MRLRRVTRPGLSLIEVIASLAIFLFSLIAIAQMLNFAGSLAAEARTRGTAARLAESKLAEVVAGAVPIQGASGTCEDEPDYDWQVAAEPGGADGLHNVTVTVSRKESDGYVVSVSLSQMVLDPHRVGNLNDYYQSQPQTASTTGSPTGSGGMTGPGAGATGGAAGAGAGAGATGGGAGATGGATGGGAQGGGNRGGAQAGGGMRGGGMQGGGGMRGGGMRGGN